MAQRASVFAVLYDGEPWREAHTSVFGRRPTFPQGCATIEEFAEQFFALEFRQAKQFALKRLSIQPMLSQRLARSLKERLVSQKTIEKVIDELVELGLLNDQQWTESFVRTQSARKMGPRAIAQKLSSKGVRGASLEEALEASWDPDEQKVAVKKLLETRYRTRNLADQRDRQKVIASLMRRGFDFSLILDCIKSHVKNLEWDE